MTWQRGSGEIQKLIAEGRLERVLGSAADGTQLLDSARRLLESAQRESTANPEASFVLAYDAARKASAALLAQQGLRIHTGGHHLTTEEAVRAQFGGPFGSFGALRRRRSEIEYPRHPGDEVSPAEAQDAVDNAMGIVNVAVELIGTLTVFRAQ